MCVCIVSSEIVMVLQFLMALQEITGSSTWEECKTLVEESYEFKYDIFSYEFFFSYNLVVQSPMLACKISCLSGRSFGEESSAKEIFEEYMAHLQEKAKDKERKREEEKVLLADIVPPGCSLNLDQLL